ncbi:MAG: hypothetical protein JWQ76_5094 [Ramlibacter sp.]|nr:hypothetical protein [Ramlibacter sp.]
MKPAPAAPVRRLVPLAAGVLAVHLAALDFRSRDPLEAQAQQVHRFATRDVAAPAPPPMPVAIAVAQTEPPPLARPPTPARPRAAPRPRPTAVAEPPVEPPAPSAETYAAVAAAASEPQPAPVTTTAVLLQSAQLPPATRMKYEVVATYRGLPLQGEGELAWRHDGKEYELQLEVRSPLLGSRRQRSVGRVTAQGLEPLHFWDKNRSEQAAHFDRERGRVTFSNNQPDVPLLAGVQDRLSVIFQLAALVAAQPASFPPGTQVAIPTASVRDAETWIFGVEREEDLQLPGGMVRALKLQRLPRREYDQKVELWLAPRMDYAPVRIRLTSPNGDTVDQRWASTDKG